MCRDALSDLLGSVRLRGAVFYYVSCCGAWSAETSSTKEIAEAVLPGCEHVMEYHMIAKGCGWGAVSGLSPVRLSAGDIVLFPQGDSHILSSAPNLEPQRREPEWVFATRNGPKPMPVSVHHGVMNPGALMPLEHAENVLVCGFLGCDLKPFNPLVAALPRILHLPASSAGNWVRQLIDQAVVESNERRPGSEAVLQRVAEMMFVDAARRYLESLPEDATGWLAGLRDRHVGQALAVMHERPDRAWTVDDLGREIGLSRSALHQRFVQYLGLPPMQYLANWRIQLGARLLRDSHSTVATIALEVGYDSEAAFSRAFKRLVGMPPATWRKAQINRMTLQ